MLDEISTWDRPTFRRKPTVVQARCQRQRSGVAWSGIPSLAPGDYEIGRLDPQRRSLGRLNCRRGDGACLRQKADQGRVQRHRGLWAHPYGIDEVALYTLFADEMIEVMRKVLPAKRQRHLVTAVVVRAHK